jgi:uncharacterized protein (TIGR03086 family)
MIGGMRPDLNKVLALAAAGFRSQLAQVDDSNLGASTPCSAWTVEQLVAHVVSSNLWVGQLLALGDYAKIHLPERVLAPDPLAAWETSQDLLDRGFRDGAKLVRHPSGEIPARQLLFFRCSDTLVHTWDLARAIGADETLDPVAVDVCLDIIEPVALALTGNEMYGSPLIAPANSDAQTQLLAMLGRAT